MKQATLILALLGAILLAGCGVRDTTSQTTFNNGSGDQPFKPITHLSHRSVVSNYFAGDLAGDGCSHDQDRLTTFTFATGSQPTYMQSSPDGTLTFVNNTGSNSISSLNNNLEAIKGTISLGGCDPELRYLQRQQFRLCRRSQLLQRPSPESSRRNQPLQSHRRQLEHRHSVPLRALSRHGPRPEASARLYIR